MQVLGEVMSVKFTTFNVENLFSRPKIFNLSDPDLATEKLDYISKLQKELKKDKYDKAAIVKYANAARGYFDINKTRGTKPLSWSSEDKTYKVRVSSKKDWDGFIDPKRAEFDFEAVQNTGKFLRSINADIIALCEVEGSEALRNFRSNQLSGKKYDHDLLIDGNDFRGIDVAILSKLPLGNIRTNIHQKRSPTSKTFSRDCLEVEIKLPSGESVWILQNHLLSKLRKTNDPRRKYQAEAVANILSSRYNLKKDLVIVAGDMNDDLDNDPMSPLKNLKDLHNALDHVGVPPDEQWTYYYKREKQKNRIDYALVSTPLKERLKTGGVDRRGMYNIDDLTNGAVKPLKGITYWGNAASDHAAVWIEFE